MALICINNTKHHTSEHEKSECFYDEFLLMLIKNILLLRLSDFLRKVLQHKSVWDNCVNF